MSLNPTVSGKLDKGIGHIFTPFVILESFELSTQLILSPCLIVFKGLKCLRLRLEQVYSSKASGIINKGDPIAISQMGGNRERTMKIRVDELKRRAMMIRGRRERIGVHLASNTWLTNGIRLSIRVQLETSDQFLLNHLLDISIIVVSKMAVPKEEINRESRSGVGSLKGSKSIAIQMARVGDIYGSSEKELMVLVKLHPSLVNDNPELSLLSKEETGEKITSQVRDMKDFGELQCWSLSPIKDRLKDHTPNPS